MRLPFQLSLDFDHIKPEKINSLEIPIDKTFPEEEANKLAALESYNKHLYRPNTYLHKWWARRSGTTFRYILKQLVDNPRKRNFYEGGGIEGKVILDPMIGGGTTLHEAIRMGANVIGIDIDPIPVLQARVSLKQASLHQIRTVFNRFIEALKEKLAYLYKTACPVCDMESEIQFVLYGLRRTCSCKKIIFVDSLILRKSNHQEVINLCPLCWEVYSGNNHSCQRPPKESLVEKGARRCEKCEGPFVDILDEPFSERYIPLVIVGTCVQHGMFYKSVRDDDLALHNQAANLCKQIYFNRLKDFRIHSGPKSKDLLKRGINNYHELFTPRQLLYLNASINFLSGLSDNDRLWLALLISTSLEFNSLLCGYKGGDVRRPGAIRHVFSHHAYSFPYTALENNPIFSGSASGTLNRLFTDRIQRAAEWAVEPVETRPTENRRVKIKINGEIDAGTAVEGWKSLGNGKRKFLVLQKDASALDIPEGIADYVVTDPPYFDSVQYSDLSNFFRVWLSQLLPHEADWHYNPLESAVSEGGESNGRKYGEVLGKIWKTCFKALKKDYGRLIFTFHHWRPEAWAELTFSLKEASFTLVNRYVVFSENPISVHIKGLKSLKHDAILVLKPNTDKSQFHRWPKPYRTESTDSYQFCYECGSALGWFLENDIKEDDIRKEWKQLIGEKGHGKTSG
ncbi:MAG: hypothetical protein SV775_10685 [Thermodesulfobacteriota bacterium]|nr:hypothetical protein [Thermodesulfobacteriota bacterium]